jgi:hypothetical protein
MEEVKENLDAEMTKRGKEPLTPFWIPARKQIMIS